MSDLLFIPAIPDDDVGSTVRGWEIRAHADGRVSITEQWTRYDEYWGPGMATTLPARVWKEFVAWMAMRSA